MPSKVTRQPYTECPYSWSLDVGGVSGGEGIIKEEMCAELNGIFQLDFASCLSQKNLLVWRGACLTFGGQGSCEGCEVDFTLKIPEYSVHCPGNHDNAVTIPEKTYVIPYATGLSLSRPACHHIEDIIGTDDGNVYLSVFIRQTDGEIEIELHYYIPWGMSDQYPASAAHIYYESTTPGSSCKSPGFFRIKRKDDYTPWGVCYVNAPHSLLLESTETQAVLTGPHPHNRNRSKWNLEYNIEETKWTLRSFSYIDYPVYELLDANPCEGESKTLVLAGRPDDAEDGCGVAPPEVTINRVCAPVAVATERRQRQTSTRLMNHKFHLCGCDCGDQVNDERQCASQCASTTTEGCETYPEEGVECRFPISADCCGYCDDQETSGKHDPPCAYEALFDCDIEHDGEQIASKVVTLRHECYFENSCQWVAVGPSPNEEDGFVGSQPVCATCADDCLTGCSWSSWQAAECPTTDCEPKCNNCWSLSLGAITLGEVSVYSGGAVTLVNPVGGYAWSDEFSGDNGYRLIAQVRVIECEVSAVVYIPGTHAECFPFMDSDLYIAYGELGGRPLGCRQPPMTVCPDSITITRCEASDRNCTGLAVVAPSSLTFTKIDCP